MMQWVLVTLAALVGGLILGAIGLVIGADYGGNFCTTCEFNGVTGYEATGQVGFLIGVPTGALLSGGGVLAFLARRKAK